MTKLLPLYFLLLCIISSQAQSNMCSKRIERLSTQLSSKTEIDEDLLLTIEEGIYTCYTEDASSYFLKGLIEIYRTTDRSYLLAYDYFESASNLGHARAKTYLAYFYKNGWDVEIDLKKSQHLLEEASLLGDPTAKYSLGYYLFKGLNPDSQDYQKAVSLFKQSTHPMARHWLAISNLYGFGLDENREEAVDILSSNDISNSKNLLVKTLDTSNKNEELNDLNFSIENLSPFTRIQELYSQELLGGLYEMEWSSNKVVSQHSFSLQFDSKKNILSIKNDSITTSSEYDYNENKISPKNLALKLPAFILDNPIVDEYTYNIKEIEFYKDASKQFYIAKLNTWIVELNEPGQPIIANLLSGKLLNEKIKKSISIYPNQFQNDFKLEFEIVKSSQIHFEMYDLNGVKKLSTPTQIKDAGSHILKLDGSALNQGLYLAVLVVDGTPFSNQVLKVN